MRLLILLACFCLLACGSDKESGDDTTVDAVFRVAVTVTADTCDSEPFSEDLTGTVDVMPRADGCLNVTPAGYWLPGPDGFEGIARKKGYVSHEDAWTSSVTGATYERSIDGIVTAGAIGVRVRAEDYRRSDGRRCVREAYLAGEPRPFGDPDVLDGTYVLGRDADGTFCPFDSVRIPAGVKNVVADVNVVRPSRAVVDANDGDVAFMFGIDIPADGAYVNTREFSYAIAGEAVQEHDGTIEGSLDPHDLWFDIGYRTLGDPSGCSHQLSLVGTKRIPAPEAVDNAYRASFRGHDGCFGAGDFSADVQVDLVTQPDGRVLIMEPGVGTSLALDGDRLTLESASDDETLRYEGTLTPPELTYAVEYRHRQPDGEWCTLSYDVIAHARFIANDSP